MENKALTPAQYWEWRTTIAEMDFAQEKLKKTFLDYKLLQRDAEILNIRMQLFAKTQLEKVKAQAESAQTEYKQYKEKLEKDLDVSLNDKIIDDITFEIKDAPEKQTILPMADKE